jgi:hypothetical protein
MTRQIRLAAAAAISLIAFSCLGAESTSAANLIKNGSIEKPVVPSGGFVLYDTGSTFFKWTVVGAAGNVAPISGDHQQFGFTFPSKRGAQWIDLTGTSNTATGIAQTVPTTPGLSYTLTFFVGNIYNPGGIGGTTSTVNVLVDGGQILAAVNDRGEGTTTQKWKRFSTTFTATSANTTIAFINGDPGSDNVNGLDAISLVPTP